MREGFGKTERGNGMLLVEGSFGEDEGIEGVCAARVQQEARKPVP